MNRKNQIRILNWGYPILFLLGILWGIHSAHAITLGKTYDHTNYEEIQDLLNPSLLNWVKKGEFILTAAKLQFEWKMSDAYLQTSLKNENKYDLDKNGILIDQKTGRPPEFYYGYPFPKIDPNDPKAAEKIMENNAAMRFHLGSFSATSRLMWIGTKGLERQVIASGDFLYFQNRYRGPLPNPNNFLQTERNYVLEPFDLRGTVSMTWTYNDVREDTTFAYLPMLRSVRRVSTSSRSDPFLGSDLCLDDVHLWGGKNSSMRWKLIGQQTLLGAFTSDKRIEVMENPDGSINKVIFPISKGFQVPGWKGAPWAPVTLIWYPRPVWILEAMPKDPSYNYGKQIFYVDKETYTNYIKEIYNKSGRYWKTVLVGYSYQVTPNGRSLIGLEDFQLAIDDKTRHATSSDMINYPGHEHRIDMAPDKMGPQNFTEIALMQLSK